MPAELVTLVRERADSPPVSWWTRYHAALQSSGMSETALAVIGLDCQYLVDRGVLAAGEPGDDGSRWPATRLRRGLVIGSVQSGKTASMLGLAAKSIDSGVDIIVVLAGTRVALWRQTISRTLAQLDGWTPRSDAQRRLARVFLPPPNLTRERAGASLQDYYHIQPNLLRRSLAKRRPVIALVMKHGDHLIRFGEGIRTALDHALVDLDRPVHMLVIDDEADDGSILDAVVEADREPESDALKQIPRHIARLWSQRGAYHTTFHPQLYATYLAYTATPQANILQSDHNPLSPNHFVAALRTPGPEGSISPPRVATYAEPGGIAGYYCGGEMFYGAPRKFKVSPCIALDPPARVDFDTDESFDEAVAAYNTDQLGKALRAFFVAAAIRVTTSGRSLVEARSLDSAPLGDVKAKSPPPTCMLVHPSGAIEDHVGVAEMIAAWSFGREADMGAASTYTRADDGRLLISPEGLAARLGAEEPLWEEWFLSYTDGRTEFAHRYGDGGLDGAGNIGWEEVRSALTDEIFPEVQLRIINSDPASDDRPRFDPEPLPDAESQYTAAPDLLTIFVSGNVMSRGITLEGLTTTLFVRSANSPAADTQTQMQRWFGYRGRYVHLCRVFLYSDQLDLFTAYHENDEALKAEVLSQMNTTAGQSPSPLVLQGARFRATAKIANLHALPLCPGRLPFVRVLESGRWRGDNLGILSELLAKPGWVDVAAAGTPRGRILGQPLRMLEAAEILEQFRYTHHDPDPAGRNNDRWRAVAAEMDLRTPEAPLFRPPNLQQPMEAVGPTACPYTIAAYLRLWKAALQRQVRGLFPTDDHRTPWSMIDLAQYAMDAPRFFIGVRYGAAGLAEDPSLRDRGIHCMSRGVTDGVLTSTWGSRNPGEGPDAYLGDHLFDYHHTRLTPPQEIPDEPSWRPRSHPGLILFHVIKIGEIESLTMGVALPLGGPDHFAALPPNPP